MNKARKSMVVATLAVSMLTCLSGCTTTAGYAAHPFSTMFQGQDPLALNSDAVNAQLAGEIQQTAASSSELEPNRL